MSIPATEPVTAGQPTGLLGLAATTSGSSEDKQLFMQMLVAQLRYQDPMNPADTSEFLSQSAQFTALEKMQNVADAVGMVLGGQMAFGASSLVGRTVTYTLADGTEGQGVVRGVTFDTTGPVLDVDGTDVPLVNVQSVVSAETAGPAGQDPAPAPTTPAP
jgi:flagellar basal-body rod modification protein FlgD